jgi:hypothetical protein
MLRPVVARRSTQLARWTPSGWAALAAITISCFLATPRVRADFADGFEAPTLDPFWSTFIQGGSITLSKAQAHSGVQSAQFSSFDTGSNKYEQLFHNFASPTYGQTSVWIYDTGAGVASSNYIGFAVTSPSFSAGLTTFDYGFAGGGPGRGDQYDYFDEPIVPNSLATGINRTLAWHQYQIIDTPQSLSLMVDGMTVYTRAGGTPFTQVLLYSQAPGFRPAFTQYYDDFAFQSPSASAPEPSSFLLMGSAGLALVAIRFLRCRQRRRMPAAFVAESQQGNRRALPASPNLPGRSRWR